MALIDQPWARNRNPTSLSDDLTAGALRNLGDLDFAQLIRSQLVPREQSPASRRPWDQLWDVLRTDDDLADRTYNVLEDFIDDTEADLDDSGLDEPGRKRAEKFLKQCERAWQRVDRGRDRTQPLAWAGRSGAFEPKARMVIATLVAAVARHRTAVGRNAGDADRQLWAALAEVNLDPRDYPDQNSP